MPRLQGDGGPGSHHLLRGGQAGLGERRCWKSACRDVLLGDERPGADLASGDEHLPPLFGAWAQHAEGYQDRSSQADRHHQVAMPPQQERGAPHGPSAVAGRVRLRRR